MRCAGSVDEQRGLVDKGSRDATYGTAGHALAAFLLKGQGLQAIDLIGAVFEGVTVDEDMARAVQGYVDYVNGQPGDLMVEYEVSIEPWTGEPGGKGTTDALRLCGDILFVNDLKLGVGVRVEAQDNEQLRLYALGAWHELQHLADINHIKLCIVQPRLDHVSTWDMSTGELLAWGDTVKVAARYAMQPDAPRVPGAKQCRWCLAKGQCAAQRRAIEAAVARAPWDDAHVADDLALAALARDWCNAIEARATDALLSGIEVPGWKLVEARTQRTWRDEGLAKRTLRKLKVKQDLYNPRALLSVAKVEKALTREQMEQLTNVISKSRGRPVLAPTSDRRPAIDLAEVVGFSILDNEVTDNG